MVARMMKNTRLRGAVMATILCGTGAAALAEGEKGFAVNIVLTERAAATLEAQHEGMILLVDYYGWPQKSAEKHADEIGQIGFGPTRRIGVSGKAGSYHVPGEALDPKRLAWLDGSVLVNVNIASARLSSPDNLLSCEIIDMPLAQVARTANTLHCGLIEGDPQAPR